VTATETASRDAENVERAKVEREEVEETKETKSDGNVGNTVSDEFSPVALDPEMEAEIS
jgi:hypothetical protein